MKKNFKCYACVNFQQCDKTFEEKCEKHNYIFFATMQDKIMCDLMCGNSEDEDENNEFKMV